MTFYSIISYSTHNPDSWSLVLDDLDYSVLFTLILKKNVQNPI